MERHRSLITFAIVILAVLGVALYCVLLPPHITLSVEATEAAKVPGQTVTLEVTVTDNPGFTDLTVYLDHDQEQLEFIRIEDSYKLIDGPKMAYLPNASMETGFVEFDGRETGYVKISSSEPIEDAEVRLFALTFRVRPDAQIGVANVSAFGEQFSYMKNGKTKTLESVVSDGGILVGKSTCMHSDEGKDMFCDLCGVQIVSVEMIDAENAYVSIENGIRLNFVIAEDITDGEDYKAHITKRGFGGERKSEVPFEQWEIVEGSYVISCPIRAVELIDQISLEIKDADGYLYNTPGQMSVRDLAMKKLKDESVSEKEKRMYVDLLNFGAAAQGYYASGKEDLANGLLEDAHRAMATQQLLYTDESVRGENYLGASLDLKEQMNLSVYFGGFYGKRSAKMYAEAIYTDHAGEEQTMHIPGSDFLVYDNDHGDGYQLPLKDLRVEDAFSPIVITVYNEDGSVHGNCTESVSSVCARISEKSSSDMFGEFIKLAASTREYLLSE